MAEPLKNYFDQKLIAEIAAMLERADPKFPSARFLQKSTKNLQQLELTDRARQVARVLHELLPRGFIAAAKTIRASLGSPLDPEAVNGMGPFKYLPFVYWVAEHGLDHLEAALDLQYQLTKRFTAEFSIRAYLIKHEAATLKQMARWAGDPDPNVRRLVSEGTRPRLPWAQRLPRFQADPAPVIVLLERLKDDPSLYVRRSVANNLNDIGKDHPDILVQVCKRWMIGATPERRWLVEHALRGAIKRGDKGALKIVGHGEKPKIKVIKATATPSKIRIGEKTRIKIELASTAKQTQSLLVDLGVHFVKANGGSTPKIFKLKRIELAPKQTATLEKVISLAEQTTRKPYPGRHTFDIRVNGVTFDGAYFDVRQAQ